MNEFDKIINSMGINKNAMNDYVAGIAFNSRKTEIIEIIKNAKKPSFSKNDLYALLFILAITFTIIISRLIFFVETVNSIGISVFTSIILTYSSQLLDCYKLMSFSSCLIISVGIGVILNHFKNEKNFLL